MSGCLTKVQLIRSWNQIILRRESTRTKEHYTHLKPTEMKFKVRNECFVCLVQKHYACEMHLLSQQMDVVIEKQYISLLNE